MIPVSPIDIYKEQLNIAVQELKKDSNLTINFDIGEMSQHVATNKQAQSLVITATSRSAKQLLNAVLSQKGIDVIFNRITRNSAYSTVPGIMNDAINKGTGSNL